MSSVFDALLKGEELPKELQESMEGKVRLRSVKKGEILQSPGAENTKGYFVKKGLLRSYVVDQKGKEHIYMFAPEGWAIGDIEAEAFNKPSQLYVDVLEDAEVLEAKDSFRDDYFSSIPKEALPSEARRLRRRLGVLQKRVIMLMSSTALERYQEFLKTYPDIVQRVPQKMIASYLGITPEALSKIRGNIAKGRF